MEKNLDERQALPADDAVKLDRRKALLKIVRTAAYAVPTATVLLAVSKDAKAGVVVGSGINNG